VYETGGRISHVFISAQRTFQGFRSYCIGLFAYCIGLFSNCKDSFYGVASLVSFVLGLFAYCIGLFSKCMDSFHGVLCLVSFVKVSLNIVQVSVQVSFLFV